MFIKNFDIWRIFLHFYYENKYLKSNIIYKVIRNRYDIYFRRIKGIKDGDFMDNIKLINNVNEQIKINQKLDISFKGNSFENSDKNLEKQNIDIKDVEKAVDRANKVFNESTHLKFEIHDKTKDIMIKIVNDETGEVIKEIPPKKILDMVAKMCEIAGIIVDEKR
ncbi:FlaG protein [Caloramator proteoclasticus DSM 10124]|uniref:FlaG protein n=2 Tax=Caloramator TaxID=44258 RepID=A0A1M4SUR8_9CLOT|nr:FlaG protein [Caloramator proteoclasticus DSM 10124]